MVRDILSAPTVSIYIYITVYIYIYIYCKNNAMFCVLLQKNKTFSHSFTFFAKECCVLCKRMLRSLRSFTFLRKERKRTQKNASFLLDFISRQKLEKRMQKNVAFRRKRTRCLTLRLYYKENVLCSYTWKIMNRNLYEPE